MRLKCSYCGFETIEGACINCGKEVKKPDNVMIYRDAKGREHLIDLDEQKRNKEEYEKRCKELEERLKKERF